jgi:hypothetical protein
MIIVDSLSWFFMGLGLLFQAFAWFPLLWRGFSEDFTRTDRVITITGLVLSFSSITTAVVIAVNSVK